MANNEKTPAFRQLILITTPKLADRAEVILRENGIPLHFRMGAEGTASSDILGMLGLVCTDKCLITAVMQKANADSILGLTAAQGHVTDIQANGKMLGIVQRIVVCRQLMGIGANVVADAVSNGMGLPHILNCDPDPVLFGQGNQGAVEFHVHVEQLLLPTIVASLLEGVHHDLSDTQQLT